MKIDRKPERRQLEDAPSPLLPVQTEPAGAPLPPPVRTDMEQAFGHDFGKVRIHADDRAAEAARGLDAKAFTRDDDVFFGAGHYQPDSSVGRRLIKHELTHVVQATRGPAPLADVSEPDAAAEREAAAAAGAVGPVLVTQTPAAKVQREPSGAPAPAAPAAPGGPAPPGPPPAAGADPDAAKALQEQEDKAFEAAKSKMGHPVAKAWYSDPKATNRSPETESFSIAEFVHPPAGSPPRKGFDNQAAATTFAVFNSGTTGAVVLQQDRFFFVGRLKKGDHRLSTVKPTFIRGDVTGSGLLLGGISAFVNPAWFRVTSDIVYRIEPQQGVVAVASGDGKHFPLSTDLTPDADRQERQSQPIAGQVPDAKDLRAFAGVAGDPEKPGEQPKPAPGIPVPEAEQRKFIDSYFRARALEALDQNESMAVKLAESFKPTEKAGDKNAPKGISDAATKLIDGARVLGVFYRDALEKEANVAAEHYHLESYRMLWLRANRGKLPNVAVNNVSKPVDEWLGQFTKDLAEVHSRKMRLLSMSPLLATMTDHQIKPLNRSDWSPMDKGVAGRMPQIHSPNPYDESLLAKAKNPQSDEAVRDAFEKKLDVIRQAIRKARGKSSAGDLDYLLGLSGLRDRVKKDFSAVQGANAGLKTKLDELLAIHGLKEDIVQYGTMAVDLALCFIPGVGPLVSAVFGAMTHAAAQVGKADMMVAATATSLDPAKALADEQELAHGLAVGDVMFLGGLLLQIKGVTHAFEGLEGTAAKAATKPGAGSGAPPEPPGAGGTAGGTGGGRTNTNWPPFDPAAPPGTNKNWPPPGDPHAPPGTNKNWPPEVDPHGGTHPAGSKTQPDPKTDVDPSKPPSAKAEVDPQTGKTSINTPPVPSGPVPTGATPVINVLDSTKYKEVPFGELMGSANQGVNPGKIGLIGSENGKKYLFKPQSLEQPIWYADHLGVQAGDRARRAPAAADLGQRLGIETPKAELVMWNGKIGSMQEWAGETVQLVELRKTNPTLHQEIMGSQAKHDLDSFQYLIAGLDAHEGNYLVKIDPQTKKWQLMPVDMDASLPPTKQRYTLGQPGMLKGHQAPLPPTMSKDFYERLAKMGKERESLRQSLTSYLSAAEIDGALARLDELLIDANPLGKNPHIKLVD